ARWTLPLARACRCDPLFPSRERHQQRTLCSLVQTSLAERVWFVATEARAPFSPRLFIPDGLLRLGMSLLQLRETLWQSLSDGRSGARQRGRLPRAALTALSRCPAVGLPRRGGASARCSPASPWPSTLRTCRTTPGPCPSRPAASEPSRGQSRCTHCSDHRGCGGRSIFFKVGDRPLPVTGPVTSCPERAPRICWGRQQFRCLRSQFHGTWRIAKLGV